MKNGSGGQAQGAFAKAGAPIGCEDYPAVFGSIFGRLQPVFFFRPDPATKIILGIDSFMKTVTFIDVNGFIG
ncbi:hypothetical protein PCC82_22465 [Agrobacterium deltaense]